MILIKKICLLDTFLGGFFLKPKLYKSLLCFRLQIYLKINLVLPIGFKVVNVKNLHLKNFKRKARLKNMLVCRHPGLPFLSTPGRPGKTFFNGFGMEKIALILIYLTRFSSSSLRPIFCFYFFCNVHVTILNLTYFNRHNLQSTG